MTTPDPAVEALGQAFRRYWSDPDMEQEDDPDWYAAQLVRHLPDPFAIVDMRAVASMLHEERLKHGTCGDHTEGYDDHMEWHEAEARCLLEGEGGR